MATYPASDFPTALDTDIPVLTPGGPGVGTNMNDPGFEHADIHNALRAGLLAVQGHVLAGAPLAPNVKTADYTLTLGDAGEAIEVNSATAKVVTVPPASSVAWLPGTVITVYQAGAGNVTVAPGSGVTIRNNAALRGQYAEASLRYRGSDEWVLAGDLVSASAPALKAYAQAIRTAGNLTLNQTAVTAASTSLDLTIAAASGDLIEYGISALLSTESTVVCFDVYTMPSGSPANPFGVGLANGLSDNKQGIPGWEIQPPSGAILDYPRISGSYTKVLVSGDVASGSTVLRLYYAKVNTTARTLFASADIALKVWAKNYGQV